MDVKCPSSGMSDQIVYENLEFLAPRDQLKFIIADRVDYLFALKVMREHEINAPIIMTPVGGTDLKELAEWVLQRQDLRPGAPSAPQADLGRQARGLKRTRTATPNRPVRCLMGLLKERSGRCRDRPRSVRPLWAISPRPTYARGTADDRTDR